MLLILVILKQLLSCNIPSIKKFSINPLIKDSQLIISINDKDLKNNFLTTAILLSKMLMDVSMSKVFYNPHDLWEIIT
jgi:hypothetical protein